MITLPKGMGSNVLAQNKKANHDYFIEETYECGMVLTGTEIKSIRAGRIQLKESFARIINAEIFLMNAHVSPYDQGNQFNHEPLRVRKLLLKKKEIAKLIGLTKEKGYTLVPLKVYTKDGYAKLLLGLGKGKKNFDKRNDLKEKDAQRDIQRALRDKQKY